MKIVWTKHAEERQREWERKNGITRSEIEDLLKSPQQVVSGDMDVLVAQSKREKGLLRVAYKDIEYGKKILTIYWTTKTEKYWKEKDNEDKV